MIKALKKICGERNVSASKADLSAYSYDGSGVHSMPSAVVWPASPDEIRKIILFCNRTNTTIVPRGLGTNNAGCTISNESVVIDMTMMNRLISADIESKQVVVEPGVIIRALNKYLNSRGAEFPIVHHFNKFSTIGGMTALNVAGPRTFKIGRMERWINFIEYLDGTGKYYVIRDGLKRVVGKEGTTGVIIRLGLRITDMIQGTTATCMKIDNLPTTFSKINELKKSYDLLCLDFLNKPASAYVGLNYSNNLILEYISNKGELQSSGDVSLMTKKREKIHDVLRPKGYFYVEDVAGSSEALFDVLSWAESKDIPVFGPLGIGCVYIMFRRDQEELLNSLYALAKEKELDIGSYQGYGLQKKAFVKPSLRSELMRLKEDYDYNNIMNRGKILNFR